jgi:two-component sensor histidine kinase
MTAIQALIWSDTRPALLVSGERTVLVFNRHLARIIGPIEKGSDLARYCLDGVGALDAYLRKCAATRDPLPGGMSLPGPNGEPVRWRCDGSVVEPATAASPATIVIRLRPRLDAHVGFVTLKQQIASLHRDLHERKALQAQLENALAEKQVLLSEVHHRVKNNLQIVTSMLSLGLTSDTPSEALQQAIERVRAIGAVQELLYTRQSFREVECCELLRDITSNLAMMYGRNEVTLALECAAVPLDVDRATSVALIVTELTINAYKHAFRDRAGAIRISLSREGPLSRLAVADNGVAFPDALQSSGTGLRIAGALARKLGGQLDVTMQPEKSVSVSFPVAIGGSSGPTVHGLVGSEERPISGDRVT